jgi:hypothetical protein
MVCSVSMLMEPLPMIFSLYCIVDPEMVSLMVTSPLPFTDDDSMKSIMSLIGRAERLLPQAECAAHEQWETFKSR